MRKIKYKKLTIQNFLSIGNETITIDFHKGLNLITGSNIDNPERKNAVGKSAIIEAFYYSLFGTTIRNINKEFIVNNITKGKGCVELFFDVQTESGTNSYKIVRQVKPTKCELFKMGDIEEDISKDSIANTNKYICDLIGSNPVICKSCDILSLSDNIPFMAKKPEEKRKFIEDIFALEIFGSMMKDLKEKIKENKSELSVSTVKLDEIKNTLTTLTEQKEAYEKKVREKELILEIKRDEIRNNLKEVEDKKSKVIVEDNLIILKEMEKYENAWSIIDGKIGTINNKISSLETLKKLKKQQIESVSSVEEVKCDKCFQDIPHSHIEHLNSIKLEYETEYKDLISQIDKLSDEKTDFLSKKEKIQFKVSEYNTKFKDNQQKEFQISSYESDIANYKRQLELLNDDTDEFESNDLFSDNIEKTKKREDEQTKIQDELKQESEDLNHCKFILGEEGVKSFIIKKLLGMLNSSIQKYINTLGMSMKCRFDEYFDEKITDERGNNLSYWSFSGGERKTVDLACAWAFKDIKRKISGISSNVEFLDEILDSAFDERGLDLLIEVIKDRIDKDKLSCYAISHRKETIKHIDGETVNLEKENKITRRV